MAVDKAIIDSLKARMPEYLERVHGITDLRKQFPVWWREDNHPSGGYSKKTHCVIDNARNEAKDVFQLASIDFGLDKFPDQIHKVAEILGEHVDDNAVPWRPKRNSSRLMYDPPERKGFDENVLEACMTACWNLLEGEEKSAPWYAREWLASRGFEDWETWTRFGLGFVPKRGGKDVHPSLRTYEEAAAGFVTVPYFDGKGEVHYCVLRTVLPYWADQGPNRKEWAPTGIGRPLYNEHYLNSGMDCIAVAEGPIDAISLTIMTGVPTIGLGSTSMVNRFCQILYYTRPDERPKRVVVNMDAADKAGIAAAAKIAAFLDKVGIPHSDLQMPEGVKDANEWLQLRAGVSS